MFSDVLAKRITFFANQRHLHIDPDRAEKSDIKYILNKYLLYTVLFFSTSLHSAPCIMTCIEGKGYISELRRWFSFLRFSNDLKQFWLQGFTASNNAFVIFKSPALTKVEGAAVHISNHTTGLSN